MKTLLFTLEYPPFFGGIASYYDNLAKHWPQDGIIVLNNNNGELVDEKRRFMKWLPAFGALWRMIKAEKINYVLVGHLLPLGTVTYLITRMTRTKYAVILHGMDLGVAMQGGRKRLLARIILSNADKIICGNTYTKKLCERLLGINKKITVITPGINPDQVEVGTDELEDFISKQGLQSKITLISINRLVKRKGFLDVVSCLPEIIRQIPNINYVIIGNGPENESLKMQIKSLNLESIVKVVNDADDHERNLWLNAADIFVMPTRQIAGDFEGFGIVYLEANLAGKPVIACNTGGVADAVKNNVSGLLIEPENREQLISSILKLAADKQLRQRLGARGRERAIEKFTWPMLTNELYKFIK